MIWNAELITYKNLDITLNVKGNSKYYQMSYAKKMNLKL